MCDLDAIFSGFFSKVPLPKEAMIENARLGVCRRLLQLCALAGGFWILFFNYYLEFSPVIIETEFWFERGDTSATDVPHCSDLGAYAYTYNKDWVFKPSSCKKLAKGEDYNKGVSALFYPTLVQDTVTSESDGTDCTSLNSSCELAKGTYSPSSEECKCELYNEFYVRNQEKNRFAFRHAFTVQESWSGENFRKGSSSMPYYYIKYGDGREVKHDGKMLTRLVTPNGDPCSVGGKSDFLPGEGDVGGTLEEWIACGGFTLDTQSDLTRSFDSAENMPPQLRTTGVKIILELSYTNRHEAIQGDIVTVCMIKVHVTPAWVSWPSMDFTVLDKPSLPGSHGQQYRYRFTQGVRFQFETGGSFSHMSPYAVISAIVNVIVLLGLPSQAIRLITLRCLGLVSKVYYNVLRQPFSILTAFQTLGTRMLTASVNFRAITRQELAQKDELEPMKEQVFRTYMRDTFGSQIDDAPPELIETMASLLLEGLSKKSPGNIELSEFLTACSKDDAMNAELMYKFFDSKRRGSAVERFFDPTVPKRQRISALHETRGAWPSAQASQNNASSKTPDENV